MKGLRKLWTKKLEEHTRNYREAKRVYNTYERIYKSLPKEEGWSLFSTHEYYRTHLLAIHGFMHQNLERINYYRELLGLKPVNKDYFTVVHHEEA